MSQDNPGCGLCGGISERIPSWGASFVLSGKDWPSKQIKIERENKILRQKAMVARYQKLSGEIPQNEVLRIEDVDQDKPVKSPSQYK